MQPRTLLVLLLLVVALGGFIFFYERDLPSTDERREQEKKVLSIDAGDVRAVTVEWQDGKVRLEREPREEGDGGDGDAAAEAGRPDPRWRLVEPLQARADRAAVDDLLTSLTGLEKERTLEDVERADLGLEEPEVEVTLETADGEAVLAVGAEVPASSDRIVAVRAGSRGAEVYQVRGGFVADLTKDPGEWRDKQLFAAARNDVERLTLVAGDEPVVLAKRGEDFWLESPFADRADGDHVNAVLAEITGLRAREFLDDSILDPAALGLEPPARTLEAILAGREEPFRLELGNVTTQQTVTAQETAGAGGNVVYGRAEGQLFEIDTRLGEAFDRAPSAWRSRSWTAIQVFKIESARLVDGEGEIEVVRDGADWKRGEDRVDYSTASDLLYAITDVEAEEVVERAAAEARGHDFAAPRLTVRLATEDGEEELLLYPAAGEPGDARLAAATAGGRDAVLLMGEETVDKILQAVDDLRQAEPLSEDNEKEESDQETEGAAGT